MHPKGEQSCREGANVCSSTPEGVIRRVNCLHAVLIPELRFTNWGLLGQMEHVHEPVRQPCLPCLKSHSTSAQQISDACQCRSQRRHPQRKVQSTETVSAGENAEDCQKEVPQRHRMLFQGKPLHGMTPDRQDPLCLSQENSANERGCWCGTVTR